MIPNGFADRIHSNFKLEIPMVLATASIWGGLHFQGVMHPSSPSHSTQRSLNALDRLAPHRLHTTPKTVSDY